MEAKYVRLKILINISEIQLIPGSGSKLGQNPGSGSKFNVFESTILLRSVAPTVLAGENHL